MTFKEGFEGRQYGRPVDFAGAQGAARGGALRCPGAARKGALRCLRDGDTGASSPWGQPERATNHPKTQGEGIHPVTMNVLNYTLFTPGIVLDPAFLAGLSEPDPAPRSVHYPWTCRRDEGELQLLATAGILVAKR